ncbi:MAG: N-6 DNA methylase [Bacteroidia bacterium]|nr:N-6 DNA methylase [Bacteroidia bacterium]
MKIERQFQGTLTAVFTEIIRERKLENKIQPYTTIEENRVDITLKNKAGNPIFFIELKDPNAKTGRSVFDSETVLREIGRAQKHQIKYFGICNFLACAFFDTSNINEKVSVSEGFFTTQEIARLSINFVASKEIEKNLRSIAEFYIERALEIIGRKAITFSQPDELYIFKIRKLIEAYSHSVTEKVWEKYKADKKFEKQIQAYASSQLWTSPKTYEEIEKLAHIALLMLISKLIFYKAYVDNQTWHNLSPMQIGKEVNTSSDLEKAIWEYFAEFIDITGDYELLIGERSDIIFQIPFVSDTVIELVKDILYTDRYYDFSKIPYDIIGRIFEELIREKERRKLGQYFTPPHVIDLINAFAINSENDKIFDPSCGSGTFLVRAYERKKQLSKSAGGATKGHEILLNEIYGNDLSGYPAYLSMLNLSIRNTRRKSYPRIINKDFFSIFSFTPLEFLNSKGKKEKKQLPQFNAIIGNPPYTRQEDIGTMDGTVNKDNIQALVKAECGFTPSQRTSIYAYFFYHASVFLKDGGYLAYIVQNSWLNTDYGVDLQQYLLRNFEIIAIMHSEVERFFPTASVNTSIVILRKQKDENIRNNNLVKFVYWNDNLNNALKYYGNADKLKAAIENTSKSNGNEFYKINCVVQEHLAAFKKWSPFLKAPQVYFDILEQAKGKFKSLSKYASVNRGFTTGANEFFIVKDITAKLKDEELKAVINNIDNLQTIKEVKNKKLMVVQNGLNEYWLIEQVLLKRAMVSPKNTKTYILNTRQIATYFFMTDYDLKIIKRDYPYSYLYIKSGEKNDIDTGSTCASRNIWYNIGEKKEPELSFSYMINDFGKTYFGKIFTNDNLHNIYPKAKKFTIFYFLNSTLSWLFQQLTIRSNFGDGVGKIQSYELEDFLIPDIDLEQLEIDLGETKNYKDELGSLKDLGTVNPERRKLDNAILEKIGYKNKKEREEVLLELYRATYQLINARLQKAQSLKSVKTKRKKVEFTVYVEQLKQLIEEDSLTPKNNLVFAKQIQKFVTRITGDITLQKKILCMYWKELFDEPFDEKLIAGKVQLKMF